MLRDPKSRTILIVPPLMQLFIFTYAITQEVKNVTVAVCNQDVGAEGGVLIRRFEHSKTFSRVLHLEGRQRINPTIDCEEAMLVLVIPQDFSESLYAKRPVKIQLLLDGRKTNAAPIAAGYATKIILSFSQELQRTSEQGVAVVTRHWFNVNLDPKMTNLPSLVCILATILGSLTAALTIAREREMGTFEQLLVSPLSPFEILIGKAIPAVLLSSGSAMMLIAIIVFVFGIPMIGSFWLLLVAMLVYLSAVVGIGLFVSSLSMTQQQAILGCILFLPPSIMLSGFATPVENMPHWLQTVTIVNPVRWFLVIVRSVFLKGMEPYHVFLNTIPIFLIALVTLTAAAAMFKKRME